MREDMYKVIVERPRKGGSAQGDGRRWRNGQARCWDGAENAPTHLGMRRGYSRPKYLNENLVPLQRWLEQQINRPWDKVFSELCANIDSRNTVQAHIHSHLDQFVERHAVWLDGQVHVEGSWPRRGLVPVLESWTTLYVHPRTGILLRNRRRETLRQHRRAASRQPDTDAPTRLGGLVVKQFDGIWYALTLARLSDGMPTGFDIVLQAEVSIKDAWRSCRWYGEPAAFATAKRQLSHGELRRLDLRND